MKAVIRDTYGGPEMLRLVDLDKPIPAGDHILVHVRAATVNPIDWHFLTGSPLLARLLEGGC